MAREATATLLLRLSGIYKNVLADGQEPAVSFSSGTLESALTTGTAVDTIDRVWSATGRVLSTARTVTNKALTSNVATLTTSVAHGFEVGDSVVVASVDSTFNGTYTITAVTATTFSYAKTATNVTSAAATGTATNGASRTLDVYDLGSFDIGAGQGRDQVGQTFALAEVTALLVVLRAGATGYLKIDTDSPSAPHTTLLDGTVVLRSAGSAIPAIHLVFSPADGSGVVTDTTAHQITFTAVGGSVIYDVHLLGRSA